MSEYIEKKFSQLDCGLELGKRLTEEIYEDLHANWVISLMNKNNFWDKNYLTILEIYKDRNIKVSEFVFGELYRDLQDIKHKLHYDGDVDIYVIDEKEENARAMTSFGKGVPSIIFLNSSLVNKSTDAQLKFIIGHELGHILNCDLQLNRMINFYYENEEDRPYSLRYRSKIVSRICELRADRCGYIACGDIETCVSALFLLNCGVDYARFGDNYEGFIKSCQCEVERLNDNVEARDAWASHPDIAIRVQALADFANIDKESTLRKKISDLVNVLHTINTTDEEKKKIEFYTLIGLMVAKSDGKISNDEYGAIEEQISHFSLFPEDVIKRLQKTNIKKRFFEAIEEQKKDEAFPILASNYVKYMLKIVVSDQDISDVELDFVHNVAVNYFDMPEEGFVKLYFEILRNYYKPIFSIYSK